jgi:hypothetical protein
VDVAEEIARRWWEDVWEAGDIDALDDLLTDPFTRHTIAGTIVASREDYKQLLRGAQRSIHRPRTTIDDRHIDPTRIWTRATSRGINLDTGHEVIISWLLLQRIEHARIIEQWVLTARDVEWRSADAS